MRKELSVLLVLLAVGAIANASAPEPAVQSGLTDSTPAAELLPADCEAVPAAFDLAAWLEQEAQAVCKAEPDDAFLVAEISKGQNCGGTICGTFQYCCNPSCGICVFYGMSCTQQSCN